MAARRVSAVRGVAARSVAGYEHNYRFSIDDEIAPLYKYKLNSREKTYLFEIRTNFVVKMFDDQDQILDSERFDAQACGNEEFDLMLKVQYRLAEYWMTNDEINEFVHKAFDFAIETGNDPQYASRLLVCVVVHLDVCTVQQENETVYSVNNRVITAEKLVPFYIWPVATGVEREQFDKDVQYYLLKLVLGVGNGFRPRIRVEDVEEGLAIMPLCDICLRGPMLGTHISVLPSCNHTFHSHCIVRRMLLRKNYLCPTCQVPAYPYIHRGAA